MYSTVLTSIVQLHRYFEQICNTVLPAAPPKVAERYICMTACPDQVHIVVQIGYNLMDVDKAATRLWPSLQCDALAMSCTVGYL
jgi:hypothetical protein